MIKTALLMLLALSCAYSCGAEKITVDPNTGPPPVEQSAESDARLAQKVTCEYWHTPVKTILAEVTKQTGVTLYAGYNKQDWQVRDRRMNVMVKDIPLANLMNSIARVMKFKWSKNSEMKPTTYRLIADRKLIGDLQAKASRLEAAIKQGTMSGRKKLLESFEKIADVSPAEMEKLKSENPYLYMCAETGFAELATGIFREIPELRDMFIGAERNTELPIKLLSPETRNLYVDVVKKQWRYDFSGTELPADYEEQLATRNVTIWNRTKLPDDPGLLKDYGLITCHLNNGPSMRAGFFDNPDSKVNQVACKTDLRTVELGGDGAQAYAEIANDLTSAKKQEQGVLESYRVLDPPVEHPDEPDLHKKINLQEQWKKLAPKPEEMASWGNAADRMRLQLVQKGIALSSGLGVVSDSFATVELRGAFDTESNGKELVDVLDSFGDYHFCNWEKHGSTLEFRSRDWFHRRSWQIPDEWVQRWRDLLERTGTLPLDDWAQMGTLDLSQLGENVYKDAVLEKLWGSVVDLAMNQGLMRFYSRLDSNQKRMLFADGLDIGLLRPDQGQSYTDIFDHSSPFTPDMAKFSDPGDRRVTMRARVDVDSDKRRKWFFTVYVEDDTGGTIDTTFQVPIPNVPVKPAPAAKSQ